jgi:hypothetical protein
MSCTKIPSAMYKTACQNLLYITIRHDIENCHQYEQAFESAGGNWSAPAPAAGGHVDKLAAIVKHDGRVFLMRSGITATHT